MSPCFPNTIKIYHEHCQQETLFRTLTQPTDKFVEEFTASVSFDQRLFRQDIRGSIAHATMLSEVGVLTAEERDQITQGLQQIEQEIENGEFEWSVAQEDVHMNIEARLIALIGEVGKKLHTGRSRNDQVATDVRLYLRDMIEPIRAELNRLQDALLDVAEREAETIMPGFTHLQTAQPVTFGHHMLACMKCWCVTPSVWMIAKNGLIPCHWARPTGRNHFPD